MNREQKILQAMFLGGLEKAFAPGCREFSVNGKLFRFPTIVGSAVEFNEHLYVGLSMDGLESLGIAEPWRAVCCYDFEGHLLWRVQPAYYLDSVTQQKIIGDQNLRLVQRVEYWRFCGKLVVYGRLGYEMDHETGELGDILWLERGPLFQDNTKVAIFEADGTMEFMRLYRVDSLRTRIEDHWVVLSGDIRGLTPLQLQNRFALSYVPTHVGIVRPPKGTEMAAGIVANGENGAAGGGTQFYFTKEVQWHWFREGSELQADRKRRRWWI
jgi:hypothetical protein